MTEQQRQNLLIERLLSLVHQMSPYVKHAPQAESLAIADDMDAAALLLRHGLPREAMH